MKPSPTVVLILSANPKDTKSLRLDEERREIEAGLMERSRLRDSFNLITKVAVRPRDVQRAMLDHTPQVVHFSGHGSGKQGLALEDEIGDTKLVNADALAALFELFSDRLQCVLLNACYSEIQAEAIAQHIPYVVGMSDAIGDRAAIEFAVAFYDALGAGRDVEFAYKNACVAIKMAGIFQSHIPVLHQKPGLSASVSKPLTSSSLSKQSHTLTEKQLSLLKWMVQEVRAGKLDGEEIWVIRTYNDTSIQGYQGEIPELKATTLEALASNRCIVYERRDKNDCRFSLTGRAYEIVDSSSKK